MLLPVIAIVEDLIDTIRSGLLLKKINKNTEILQLLTVQIKTEDFYKS